MQLEDKIKIILIDHSFLRVLAGYFIERFKDNLPDFSKVLVVFPSERNKFYFRRYLLEITRRKAIIPPKMLTIEELRDFIYEKIGGERAKVLETIERNFILKKTIDELKIENWQDLPFLRFISIGNRLLSFYDELSQERIDIEDIEKKSIELHFSERYVKNELPILKKVYHRYRENLIKAGYKDRIDEFNRIYENYDSRIFEEFDYIIIAGIAATTSFEKLILSKMISELPAELILHSGTPDEIALSSDLHKRFYLHYKLLNFLKLDISKIEVICNGMVPRPVIHIKPLETITKETFYLGDVVREAIKRYRELHRIGIILTDESLLFPITEMLRFHSVEYNLSAGIPFSNLIFYSFLKHLYDAINNNLHYTEFFVFLQHPLIKNAVINNVELRPLVYGLRNKMITDNRRYFQIEKNGVQTMLQGLEPGFAPLVNFLERCFTTVCQKLNFNEYIDNLIKLLNDVLSYNQEIIRTNFPRVKEFFDRLHNLSQLRIGRDAIPPGIDTLEFILRILLDGQYYIEGEPLKGIQIIGVLESRNLDFDCLILPSMNEGIFPKSSEKDMFLNPALRKEMGLITDQERSSLYHYYFTQMISGKKEVFISYINEEKGDIPSRFVMMLESAGYPEDRKPMVLIRNAITIKERSVKKDKKIIKVLMNRFKDGFSHSALKSYKSCPYQFYLNYILNIEKPVVITEDFDAVTFGKLFHIIAEEFYKNHYPSGFKEKQLEEATKKIEELLQDYIKSGKYVALPLKSSVQFDIELYKRYLRNFLKEEIKRFKDGYTIYTKSQERHLSDTLKIKGKSIPLTGFVDRIDIKDGLYYIIDYKTGAIPGKRSYEIGDEFVEFQLPLYALMFSNGGRNKVGGLFYYKIGKKIETKRICDEGQISDYLDEFKEEILIPTISEIIDEDIPFYPAKNKPSCEYCLYQILCGGR